VAPRKEPARRVLVVDDDADLRAALRALIEMWGMEVAEAGDGARGVELACASRPDVIILDLLLPGTFDGFDAARRIRSVGGYRPRIIAFTGYFGVEERAREAGCDACLLKPAEPEALRQLIELPRKGPKRMERSRPAHPNSSVGP